MFVDYSSTLYNFEQVRREMDFIRGKTDKHGNVRIKQFLNALLLLLSIMHKVITIC
ncbi:MAG: DNA-binding domain-containing protein [Dorea formicigenerans]